MNQNVTNLKPNQQSTDLNFLKSNQDLKLPEIEPKYEILEVDHGIGLEGGIEKIGERHFESGYCAVVNPMQNIVRE